MPRGHSLVSLCALLTFLTACGAATEAQPDPEASKALDQAVQVPPVGPFEELRGLLFPGTPVEEDVFELPAGLGPLERARHLLARPDLDSRTALYAWKLARDHGEAPPPEVARQVLGVVVDIGLGTDILVVAAYADGQPRFFLGSGGGIIGDDWKEEEIQRAKNVVRVAQDLVQGMAPGQEQPPPLPKPGRARFTLLTPGGAYMAEDSHELMSNGEGRYAPLYAAVHALYVALDQRYQETEGQPSEGS